MEQTEKFYYYSEKPEIIYETGEGSPVVVFNVATHGDEYQPVVAVEEFLKGFNPVDFLGGKLVFTISNPAALRARRRFLYEDLNRAYPGNISGQGESRIASQMIKLVAEADYLIDLHTAPNSPPFIILGARNQARLQLAELAPIKPIVLFEAAAACALVDFTKCGIGVELGDHDSNDSVALGISSINYYLSGLGLVKNFLLAEEHEYYEIYKGLTIEEIPSYLLGKIKDFQPIKDSKLGIQAEGEFSFPVLCGVKDYSPIYCYLAKKVKRERLTGVYENK